MDISIIGQASCTQEATDCMEAQILVDVGKFATSMSRTQCMVIRIGDLLMPK